MSQVNGSGADSLGNSRPAFSPESEFLQTSGLEVIGPVRQPFTVIPREQLLPLIRMAHSTDFYGGRGRVENPASSIAPTLSTYSSYGWPVQSSSEVSRVSTEEFAVPSGTGFPRPNRTRLQRRNSERERPLFHPYRIPNAPRRRVVVVLVNDADSEPSTPPASNNTPNEQG
jgi:hypothetical protein